MEQTKVFRASEKGLVVLEFLKGQEGALTGAEIAEATGMNPQGIHGVLKPLTANGLVDKSEKIRVSTIDKNGLAVEKEYKGYAITEAGRVFEQPAE